TLPTAGATLYASRDGRRNDDALLEEVAPMSTPMSASVSMNSARLASGLAGAGLAGVFCAAALWLAPVAAQQTPKVPDIMGPRDTAWFPVGDEFLPPPGGGPGPITFDQRYPYVDNGAARRAGKQPTYRIADLSNPI